MKITRKTNINEIIKKDPKLIEEFFKAGMVCVGCPLSARETIEQGCLGHGLTDKEIDKLILKLNKKLKKEK